MEIEITDEIKNLDSGLIQHLLIDEEAKSIFINPDYLEKFKLLRYYIGSGYPVVSYITCGILLMMMGYCVSKMIGSSNKKTFLYFFLYSSTIFATIFLNTLLKRHGGEFSSFFN